MTIHLKPHDRGLSLLIAGDKGIFEGKTTSGKEFVVVATDVESATKEARDYFKDSNLTVCPDFFTDRAEGIGN